ncbi:MAG: hypothetical protein HQ481_05135 [Alphaproteobacteria bacterium]|nr:hypothetical protein [Alphaproteobacteria bacterium]
MKEIFLGKPLHWALLVVTFAILWVTGENHLHTSEFNVFAGITFAVGLGVMTVVVLTHRKGERITREPIELTDEELPSGD